MWLSLAQKHRLTILRERYNPDAFPGRVRERFCRSVRRNSESVSRPGACESGCFLHGVVRPREETVWWRRPKGHFSNLLEVAWGLLSTDFDRPGGATGFEIRARCAATIGRSSRKEAMMSLAKMRGERYRIWVAAFDDWQPGRWQDVPPRAVALEPADDAPLFASRGRGLLGGVQHPNASLVPRAVGRGGACGSPILRRRAGGTGYRPRLLSTGRTNGRAGRDQPDDRLLSSASTFTRAAASTGLTR